MGYRCTYSWGFESCKLYYHVSFQLGWQLQCYLRGIFDYVDKAAKKELFSSCSLQKRAFFFIQEHREVKKKNPR